MALEAMRQSAPPLADRAAVDRFVAQADAALIALARALRAAATPAIGTALRETQTALHDALKTTADDASAVLAAAWIDASDRIADSIGTLAHLLTRDASRASG